MKIKTLVNVTCSETGKVAPYNGIVVGKIRVVIEETISIQFRYLKNDENETVLVSGNKFFTDVELDEIISTITLNGSSYVNQLKALILDIFKIQMATTFGIELNQLESL